MAAFLPPRSVCAAVIQTFSLFSCQIPDFLLCRLLQVTPEETEVKLVFLYLSKGQVYCLTHTAGVRMLNCWRWELVFLAV